ncbi:hypothetical protein CISG_00779 [Coccidioides immitis RMSCC 3703]|uniref:Uncharacterized protein n=2 Tax=Coccidioides immitis TaxID=5501 RepID=A0A0J8QQJ5_COCIT|nr:hypothetical protein CIRG_03560 [Coccidioides immitis RMSCC 2394]KMU74849.1 hypothetical protein CISG_00779 [Coccidioides immitis RMSCC 3703]
MLILGGHLMEDSQRVAREDSRWSGPLTKAPGSGRSLGQSFNAALPGTPGHSGSTLGGGGDLLWGSACPVKNRSDEVKGFLPAASTFEGVIEALLDSLSGSKPPQLCICHLP